MTGLDSIPHAAADGHLQHSDRVVDPQMPVPFEEFFVPLVRDARARVRREAGDRYALLGGRAHITLERALLVRTSSLCSRALYAHFGAFRSTSATLFLGGLIAGPDGSDQVYRAFLHEMQMGGLARFLREYSVLGRLCGTVADLWVEATVELLHRLEQDRDALDEVFGKAGSLGMVQDLSVGVGDTHDGGRSVLIMRFRSGLRLVYKPRPIGLEVFYGEVVNALGAEEVGLLDLKTPVYLAREDYGWIEFVDQRPCVSERDVTSFYRRMGMILALVYVMNGHDFHLENLIASGPYPVLIDLETLLRHGLDVQPTADVGYQGEGAARTRFQRSVAPTGLLPLPWRLPQGGVVDLSGLGAPQLTASPHHVPCWRDTNTDQMRLDRVKVAPTNLTNVPELEGRPHFATNYIEDIVNGFQGTYLRLIEIKQHLFNDACLARLGRQHTRFVLRHTNLYAQLLEQGLHPKYLLTETGRSKLLNALAAPLRELRSQEARDAILESELHALQQMDVPCFRARAGERSLELPTGQRIEDFFDRSAMDEVRTRIATLSRDDLAFQVELIRMALNSRAAVGLRPPPTGPLLGAAGSAACRERSKDQAASVRLDSFRQAAVREATRIAALVERRALQAPGEPPGWIGIRYTPSIRWHICGPIPPTVFSGSAGVAFFLAAVDRLTSTSHRRSALEAVESIRSVARMAGRNRQAVEDAIRFHWSGQLGIAEGLAGGIYALTHLATFLESPELADDAARLAAHATVERARFCDASLLNGVAGIVLALLALHRRHADERLLTQAAELGSLLLETRGSELVGAGLALGATGTALALLRLHQATRESHWWDGARSALTKDAERLQSAVPDDLTWAEGLTGLVLVQLEDRNLRTGSGSLTDTVDRIRANLWSGGDSLCSGAMGKAELLAAAGYCDESRGVGLAVLDRAAQTGRYRLGWGEGCPHVGLFQGATGVAYQLLRLAYPDEVPSILTWE